MRIALSLLMSVLLVLPTFGHAGAWLREKGTTFTAVTFSATYFRDIANTTYIEHGLRENMTLGADVSLSSSRTGEQSGYGTIFLRMPLGKTEGKSKWAYELGLGATWRGAEVSPHLKTGLSWGRGIQIGEKYGWMAVDASITWNLGEGAHLTKIDTTVGLNFTDQTAGMVQLYLSHLDGEGFGTFAPSVIWKPKAGKFRLQLGFEAPMRNMDDTALKLGIWREF